MKRAKYLACCACLVIFCMCFEYREIVLEYRSWKSVASIILDRSMDVVLAGSLMSAKGVRPSTPSIYRTHQYGAEPRSNSHQCENILSNMTRGRWVRKKDLSQYKELLQTLIDEEKSLESELSVFWVKRGIQTAFWRKDFRCGYFNYETQPNNTAWPKVGSWCDPKGEKPCCSNILRGTCMKVSAAACNCAECVDLRRYKYAEVSDWIVADRRCDWKKYTASEVCDVVERSPFSDIHFVGDSFMRNMFRTFAMMITGDYDHGAVNGSTPDSERKLCTKRQQFFWRECRRTLDDVSKTLYPENLCGGRGVLNFNATFQLFYSIKFKNHFLELVKSKINVPGSLIIVGVGFHMQCNSEKTITHFLKPAVDAITDHYGEPPHEVDARKLSLRWPQIIFCLPLTIGLLKPTTYLKIQNEMKCSKYSSDMKSYAAAHDVRVMDFRQLTKHVFSFDGTHHGMGVNRMKNMILLNFIESLVT